jgi:hypothetical protein
MTTGFHALGRVGAMVLLTILFLLLFSVNMQAQYTPASWPLTFIDYTDSTGNYIQDISDQNPSATDIIFSATTPSSVAVACDGSTVFFRMQLADNPWGGNNRWASFAWVVAFSDSTGQGAPVGHVSVNASGNGLTVEVKDASTTDVVYSYAKNNGNPGAVRSVAAGSSGYFYLDFQVPIAALTSRIGMDIYTEFRLFYGSSASGGTINKDYMSGSEVDFIGLTTTNFSGIEHGGLTPNPVELTAFSAHVKQDRAILRWHTATELNNFGFEVQRSSDGDTWRMIGFVPGSGTSASPRSYSFEDAVLPAASSLRYRLRQIDRDGSFEYSPIVEARQNVGRSAGINGSFPIPARSVTTVNYFIETPGPSSLTLHDLSGRLVRTVSEHSTDAGAHSAILDVDVLPRGMYMLRLSQPGSVHVHPLIVTD